MNSVTTISSVFRSTKPLGLLACLYCGLIFSAQTAWAQSYPTTRHGDPIHWMQWNETTLATIRKGDRPVMFSISHELNDLTRSMAEESFHNNENADLLNASCYCVLVDRYEHPQLAGYFQTILQGTKQIVGSPLTVFVTPELKWIDGGGYFPPSDTWGGQGFPNLLKSVIEKWTTDVSMTEAQASKNQESFMRQLGVESNPSYRYSPDLLHAAIENLLEVFDAEFGGFFVGPKTPDFAKLRLLDEANLHADLLGKEIETMKQLTLNSMERSSLYDFIKGGFFASATDDRWLVPQFMKSSDDQCQAIEYYHDKKGSELLVAEIARSLVSDFKMQDGFYSAHVLFAPKHSYSVKTALKGQPYFWDFHTLKLLLTGEELDAFTRVFDIAEGGNIPEEQDPEGTFSGKNLLRLRADREGLSQPLLRAALGKLKTYFEAENRVIHEKTVNLVSNARLVGALAIAGDSLEDAGFLTEARTLFERVWDTFYLSDTGRLMSASILDNKNSKLAEESDALGYALLIRGAILLHKCTGEPRFLHRAELLQTIVHDRFMDAETGLCFVTPKDQKSLPFQPYAFWEEADSSAVAVSIENLKQLSELTKDPRYQQTLELLLQHLPEAIEYAPEHFPYFIRVLSQN